MFVFSVGFFHFAFFFVIISTEMHFEWVDWSSITSHSSSFSNFDYATDLLCDLGWVLSSFFYLIWITFKDLLILCWWHDSCLYIDLKNIKYGVLLLLLCTCKNKTLEGNQLQKLRIKINNFTKENNSGLKYVCYINKLIENLRPTRTVHHISLT